MDRLYLRPAGRGATRHAPEPATVVVAGCVCRGFGEGLKGGALRGQKRRTRVSAPHRHSQRPRFSQSTREMGTLVLGADPRVGVVLRTENARSHGACR